MSTRQHYGMIQLTITLWYYHILDNAVILLYILLLYILIDLNALVKKRTSEWNTTCYFPLNVCVLNTDTTAQHLQGYMNKVVYQQTSQAHLCVNWFSMNIWDLNAEIYHDTTKQGCMVYQQTSEAPANVGMRLLEICCRDALHTYNQHNSKHSDQLLRQLEWPSTIPVYEKLFRNWQKCCECCILSLCCTFSMEGRKKRIHLLCLLYLCHHCTLLLI